MLEEVDDLVEAWRNKTHNVRRKIIPQVYNYSVCQVLLAMLLASAVVQPDDTHSHVFRVALRRASASAACTMAGSCG